MNKSMILAVLTMVAAGAAAGAGAGYYAALTLPVAPQAVVLDGRALGADLLNANADDPVARAQLEARLVTARAHAKALAEQGLIVLDADAVLQAPAEAYVTIPGAVQGEGK